MALYSSETYEKILNRMLSRVPAKFDKREGSIIYDATAPAALELLNVYLALDSIIDEVFADTASREYLIRRCAERGITPKEATKAVATGSFTPVNLEVPIGARFSLGDFNYVVTKKIEAGYYYLECETAGREPNGVTGQLIPIDYVEGLQRAEITEVSILGEDEEETEALRNRYFASLTAEAFGGNKIDYKNKILSQNGVGGVKIYSGAEWNGGGTVKAVIIDSEKGVPTFDLVNAVQTAIDPEANQGEGIGLAPIGHFVTVIGAYDTKVNIETTLTYEAGQSWASLKTKIEEAVDSYFKSLNETWQDSEKITVILARLESYILGVTGVLDIQNTTLNGKAENIVLDKDSLVSRGTINGY